MGARIVPGRSTPLVRADDRIQNRRQRHHEDRAEACGRECRRASLVPEPEKREPKKGENEAGLESHDRERNIPAFLRRMASLDSRESQKVRQPVRPIESQSDSLGAPPKGSTSQAGKSANTDTCPGESPTHSPSHHANVATTRTQTLYQRWSRCFGDDHASVATHIVDVTALNTRTGAALTGMSLRLEAAGS